jgi:arylsulfatase
MRAIVEPRFKFARYFAPAHHHRPVTAEQLFEKNDLELYDTNTDPDELHNLAHDPNHRERVEVLNGRLNTLIDHEVGRDDGHEFGGDLTRFS